MNNKKHFGRALVKNNPLLTMFLGICPALAVTTSARLALRFGLVDLAVLLFASVIISGLKRVVPDQVRLICYMLISCTLAVLAGIMLNAYLPSWGEQLQSYIPMLAVSSLILGRAELFAGKRTIQASAVDAVGMGLGYLLMLLLLGGLREALGTGSLFGVALHFHRFVPLAIFTLAPGGLFLLGMLAAVFRKLAGAPADETVSAVSAETEEGGRA